MRIFAILGGLVLGLVGLFMSVCGGGFLFSMGSGVLRNLFGAHPVPDAFGGIFLLLVPALFLAMGIVACGSAYTVLREHFKDKD